MATRAVRANNPGNLNAGESWEGLMPPDQMTPEQKAETRFAVFQSPSWGFRALGKVLLTYYAKHGLNSVEAIIKRWAPPNENNTQAYIKAVCDGMGVAPDAALNLKNPTTLRGLAKAIAIHESGGWFFTQDDLAEGINKAEL